MTDETDAEQAYNELLQAIGRVTVAGAFLDSSLHNLLAQLTFEPTLLAFANGEGTDKLIQFCQLALKNLTVPEEDIERVRKALTRADELRNQRNAVVHSIYMMGEDAGVAAFKPARRAIGAVGRVVTIESLKQLAVDVEALRGELFKAGWNVQSHASGMPRIEDH